MLIYLSVVLCLNMQKIDSRVNTSGVSETTINNMKELSQEVSTESAIQNLQKQTRNTNQSHSNSQIQTQTKHEENQEPSTNKKQTQTRSKSEHQTQSTRISPTHSKKINRNENSSFSKKRVEKESSRLPSKQMTRTKSDIEATESEVSAQSTLSDDIHHHS
jgi:preprotein translocase subunit SecF